MQRRGHSRGPPVKLCRPSGRAIARTIPDLLAHNPGFPKIGRGRWRCAAPPRSDRFPATSQGGAQVIVLAFQPVQPELLVRLTQFRRGFFCPGEEKVQVAVAQPRSFRPPPPVSRTHIRGSFRAGGSAPGRPTVSATTSDLFTREEIRSRMCLCGDFLPAQMFRAVSSVQPASKTARRRSRTCSSSVKQHITPIDGRTQCVVTGS